MIDNPPKTVPITHQSAIRAVTSRRPDVIALAMLLLEALLLGGAAITRRPDLTATESFLYADQSLNLLIADRLLSGDQLYAGIFSPYGAVGPYLHAAIAAMFGNTVATYNALLLLLTMVNVVLAYLLVRSRASIGVTVLVVGVGLMPNFLIPGSLLGGFTVSSYIPIERGLLLATALAWNPPAERTRGRAAAIGALLGSWQWVKFGGGIFAGVVVVILDALALALYREKGSGRKWLRGFLIAAGVLVTIELARIGVAFATLPVPIAWDVVWPAYHLETYRSWVTADQRWLSIGDLRLFVGQYLTPLAGAVLAFWGAFRLVRRSASTERLHPLLTPDLRLLFPAVFLVAACFGYLQQAHIIRQFLWTLVLSSSLGLAYASPLLRGVVLLLWIPCFALNARAMLMTDPPSGLVAMDLPEGSRIWTRAPLAAEVQKVAQVVDSLRRSTMSSSRVQSAPDEPGSAGQAPVLFVPMGAGFHAFYDIPTPIRQPWLIPGFVRPYDAEALLLRVGDLSAIVVQDRSVAMAPGGSSCPWLGPLFPPEVCSAIDERLGDPIPVGAEFTVYPMDRIQDSGFRIQGYRSERALGQAARLLRDPL